MLEKISTPGNHEAVDAQAPEQKGPLDLLAIGCALLLPIAFSPLFNAPFSTGRAAILLVATGIAAPRLVTMVVRRDSAALALGGYLLVSAISTIAATRPALALFGSYDTAPSFLFAVSLAAMWALGRSVGRGGRAALIPALLIAIAVNVLVAVAQRLFDMRQFNLEQFRGSYGLLGNPVHLGALLAGGVAAVATAYRVRPARWAPLAIGVGAGLQFSGSRLGTLVAVGIAVAMVAAWPRARMLGFVGCLVGGFVAAVALQPLFPHSGADSVTSKVASADRSNVTVRAETWLAATLALRERPALGFGPGRFVEASSPHRTVSVAKGDPETIFLDSHNILVEVLVTTGPVGFACFIGFLIFGIRRSRGVLFLVAMGILAVELAEPQSVALTPVAFLCLGASCTQEPVGAAPRRELAASLALAALGLACAVRLMAGDYELKQASLDFSVGPAKTAIRLLPPWPTPMSKLGQIYVYEAKINRADRATAERSYHLSLAAFRAAGERDPAQAAQWNNLGNVALSEGDVDIAEPAFRRALVANPWSASALIGLAYVEHRHGNEATANDLLRRARLVLPDPSVISGMFDRHDADLGEVTTSPNPDHS